MLEGDRAASIITDDGVLNGPMSPATKHLFLCGRGAFLLASSTSDFTQFRNTPFLPSTRESSEHEQESGMSNLRTAGWILLIAGGCLIWYGIQEYQVGSDASPEPVDVDLAALEAGEPLPDDHVKIGLRHSLYSISVFNFEDEDGTGRMKRSSKLNWLSTPLISDKHPDMDGIRKLEKKYGSIKMTPRNADWPPLKDFVVILKSKANKTVGDVPTGRKPYSPVTGLVINRIESLGGDEQRLIRQKFPKINFDKVCIVEHGRKPSSTAGAIAVIVVGALLVLLCVALLNRVHASHNPPPPRIRLAAITRDPQRRASGTGCLTYTTFCPSACECWPIPTATADAGFAAWRSTGMSVRPILAGFLSVCGSASRAATAPDNRA